MACCLSSPSQLWLFPAWRCEQLLESVLRAFSLRTNLLCGGAIRQGFFCKPRLTKKKKRASVL